MRIKSIEVKADLGEELVKPPYINHNPQISKLFVQPRGNKARKGKILATCPSFFSS